jgi:hypothetical protein
MIPLLILEWGDIVWDFIVREVVQLNIVRLEPVFNFQPVLGATPGREVGVCMGDTMDVR